MLVILRLCTNDSKVVKYWDDVDKMLELEMDVLDDLVRNISYSFLSEYICLFVDIKIVLSSFFLIVYFYASFCCYYNLNYSVGIIQCGDAEQVENVNPWLTYNDALHKMREFGASIKEMDLIDETKLSSEQMRVVLATL